MSGKSRREQIEQMLLDDPNDDGFLRYALAMEYLSAGDEAKALESLQQLVAASPEYVPGYQQLGQLLTRLGREDEAKVVYRDGIALARRQKNQHAADEMTGFLAMLE